LSAQQQQQPMLPPPPKDGDQKDVLLQGTIVNSRKQWGLE
jgi:hypothetical protein